MFCKHYDSTLQNDTINMIIPNKNITFMQRLIEKNTKWCEFIRFYS